jgi:FkbH-like protein
VTQADPAVIGRIRELFERTTQFNATGRRPTIAELQRLTQMPDGRLFTLRMRDRFTDHGLVGAVIVVAGEIVNFVLSCRVIGLGGERQLLAALVADAGGTLRAQIIPTGRNTPVRNLYADNGFTAAAEGWWSIAGGT